jgi:Nif-specific regulatory protein
MERKDSGVAEDLLRSHVADFERHIVASALERTGGNLSEAARQLGTTRRIIMYRVRKYGIELERYGRQDAKK